MANSIKLFMKTVWKFALWGFSIIAGLILLYIISVIVMASFEEIDVDGYIMNFSSKIYYMNEETGNEEELGKVYGKENRVWISYTDMPEHLSEAAIAIEDERFLKHHGIDFKRTIGATVTYVFDRSSGYGGSTITQQLVKNLTGNDDRSITRKIKEMWIAMRLERKLSKEQILELYLNTIYLSQGCNGVGAAAEMYFDKAVNELTIGESAALVGITQYPTRYDPFINPTKNKEKQELVLKKMLELGFITDKEHEEAVNEKLSFVKSNMKQGVIYNSYFVDQVITDVANDLVEQKGYTYDSAIKMIHTGGFRIYATIDPKVQKIIDKVYENEKNFGSKGQQSAMVIIDPKTGEVKGLSGGVGIKSGDFVLNRATMSPRQPGSAIKPISVYAPAIENGIIKPTSVYSDKKITIGDWSPKNYYTGFRGDMTVVEAVKISANTIPIQILQELGVNKSFDFLKNKLGVTTLVDKKTVNDKVVSDKNLPALALGGLTDGMTTMELAGAYTPFVNDGLYIKPHTYSKVVDKNGKTILENKSKGSVAMSESTANTMCQMLSAVTSSGGTGVGAALPNMATGGKTGTTDDDKDRWYVGITPYYVGAVWYGFDQPKELPKTSSNPALTTWKKVMVDVHKGLKYKSFKGAPISFVENGSKENVEICTVSGKLLAATCVDENGKPTSETKEFKKSDKPKEVCTPQEHIKKEPSDSSHPSPTPPVVESPVPTQSTKPTPTQNPVIPTPSEKPTTQPSKTPQD